MHIALNTKLDVRFAEKYPDPINPEELWLRAEEAYELEDYEKSQKLIGKVVKYNPKIEIYFILIYMQNNCRLSVIIENVQILGSNTRVFL